MWGWRGARGAWAGGHGDRGGSDEYGFDIYGTPSEKRHFQKHMRPGALAAQYVLSQ
jgi:hypothetical protein